MNKALLIAFIAVMAGDLLVPYLLAPLYKGYSHRTMVMSSLGNPKSPVRFAYCLWLTLGGLVFGAGSVALILPFLEVSKPLGIAALVLLLAFAAGAMVISGLFSVDEGKQQQSTAAKIHGAGAALGFIALLFVPLLLAVLQALLGNTAGAVLSGASFALAFAAFVLFVLADKESFKGTDIAQEGTWQRLTLLFMYLPIVYVCFMRL